MDLFRTDYLPQAHCFHWDPVMVYEHVVYNFLLAGAYVVFPAIVFTKLRQHLLYLGKPLWISFAAFVFCCGIDRTLLGLSVLWWPAYSFMGFWHLITASVSWVAVSLLILNLGRIQENMNAFREVEVRTQILDERLKKIQDYENGKFRN